MKMNHGFSVTELLFVVAIIAILSTLAIPAYNDYVADARRTEARTALSNLMIKQEKELARKAVYSIDIPALIGTTNTEQGFYTLSAEACGSGLAECVKIIATSTHPDAKCPTIFMISDGTKGPNGCW